MTVGDRIEHYREVRSLTRAQLADACKVDVRQVYRWECGDTKPSADNLTDLAVALNVSIDRLLTGREY
jgi:transcriptional regulator with XRE-family HTH domain